MPPGALATLKQAWSAVPDSLRQHPDLVTVYARQLLRQGAPEQAGPLLAKTLERVWDERLVLLYGEVPGAQLEVAEEWQARHGDSTTLLLTLGRLARHSRQGERARGYLEKSLTLGACAAAHTELGLLFQEAGDNSQALQHCRQALELCQDGQAHPRLNLATSEM